MKLFDDLLDLDWRAYCTLSLIFGYMLYAVLHAFEVANTPSLVLGFVACIALLVCKFVDNTFMSPDPQHD